ncbi:MAG: pentapeptide repeat-containing protein [Chloroflexi bacterium]|nr:pentapeptide repeat-containing protein [Chloroflexota bacterium]
MPVETRREEIRKIHRKYRFFYEMLGGAVVLVISVFIGAAAFSAENVDYRMNLFTEGMSIVATVFMINRWYSHRERESLKRRLIREAGSRSHDIAISAVEWMEREGWLRGEDGLLKGANLTGARLRRARLEGANLEGAELDFADLRGAGLQKAKLNGVNLFMADLRNCLLKDADLCGANLYEAKLRRAALPGANMESINGVDVDMSNTSLLGTVLKDADLKIADLQGAFLWETDFTGANLLSAKLANVEEAKLAVWERATLSRVDLRAIDLEKANMKGAILRYADLRNANLAGTNLENADLYGAYLQNANVRFWTLETESYISDVQDTIRSDVTRTTYPETNFVGARLPDGTYFTENMDTSELKRFVFPTDERFGYTLEKIKAIRR